MADKNFWKGKKVFLTGHTGFKGSWLTLWLSQMGASVKGYALAPHTEPNLFTAARLSERCESVYADIRDRERLIAEMNSFSPDIAIHMAAQPLVRDSYRIPVETYEINVMGTVNFLEACRVQKNLRAVLNVTTDKVYENREWCWGYRESEPFGGYDPYSNSKACSELVTAAYRSSFFNTGMYGQSHTVALASARAGNVIGGGDWASDRLIPDILKAITRGEPVVIRNPQSIRPWQHVLEPLSGYILLCERLYGENGALFAQGWNFGPGDDDAKPVQWIVETLCRQWGQGASFVVEKRDSLHEANYLKLDNSKARHDLDWKPTWDISTALEMIIEWTKVHLSGGDVGAKCFEQIEFFIKSRNL